MTDLAQEILAAAARLRGRVRETPVELSQALSELAGARVFLKLENQQITGSFKIRGATNKLLSLTTEERDRGVVAASSGNHGLALAHALTEVGGRGLIFVPESASPAKVEAIRALGVEIREQPGDPVMAEVEARRYAADQGMIYLSPYNDLKVVAGQGMIAVELSHQIENLAAVFVAVGGGGLTSGIAAYLKSLNDEVEVIACSPRNSAVMHESVHAGRILELDSEPTLSDGTAGGVEQNAITFDLCRRLVDRWVLVSEDEIAAAMRLVIGRHHTLIEGAAGVAVAGYVQARQHFAGRTVAIILCGANISPDTLCQVLTGPPQGTED